MICILWSRIGTPLSQDSALYNAEKPLTGTTWEFWDAMNAPQETRPLMLTYRCQREIKFAPDDPPEKFAQLQGVSAFFQGFKDPQGAHRFSVDTYHEPTEFKEKLSRHLRDLLKRWAQTQAAATPQAPAKKHLTVNPYPGMRTFSKAQAEFFFGRDRETDQLLRKLQEGRRFVAVLGGSGTGKSSLLWAGLRPRLENGAIPGAQHWPWVSLRPADDHNPFQSLASAAGHLLAPSPWRPSEMAKKLADTPDAWKEMVGELLAKCPEGTELLLFIDQFEELFTLIETAYQTPFLERLEQAARLAQVRVILTMREEFVPHCARCPPLANRLSDDGTLWLSPPGPLSLSKMICRPAERVGVTLEEGLAERIIQDTLNQPGGLAIMAFALAELYLQRSDETQLSLADYAQKLGGVEGVIARRAAEATEGVDLKVLHRLFNELVQINAEGIATRRRAPKARLTAEPVLNTLVNNLIEARLLVASGQKSPIVEVVHERLFEAWEPLANWIEAWRDDLRLRHLVESATREWARSGRDSSHLWPHERLKPVYEMLERLGFEVHPDPLVRDFIQPEAERLLAELDCPETDHYRRAAIGDRLDHIGDLRFGVGLDEKGLPAIDWVAIPGGEVALEGEAGRFQVQPFEIARYPVTYRQYRAFLETKKGYPNPQWWQGLRHEETPGEQYRLFGNCPADNVSWYDAMAFCRWLSAQLGEEIRLPAEWEWQQAATGVDGNSRYPWGYKWQEDYANTFESRLGHTTAVGMYPQGATSQGVLDMAGNVWEWCLPGNTQLEDADWRVARGFSWSHDPKRAHAARVTHRGLINLHGCLIGRHANIGFRVCRCFPH